MTKTSIICDAEYRHGAAVEHELMPNLNPVSFAVMMRHSIKLLAIYLLCFARAASVLAQTSGNQSPVILKKDEVLEVSPNQTVSFTYAFDHPLDKRSDLRCYAVFGTGKPDDKGNFPPDAGLASGVYWVPEKQSCDFSIPVPFTVRAGTYRLVKLEITADGKTFPVPSPNLQFEVVEDITYHSPSDTDLTGKLYFNPTKAQYFRSRAKIVRISGVELKQSLARIPPRNLLALRAALQLAIHQELEQIADAIDKYPSMENDPVRVKAGVQGLKDIQARYFEIQHRLQVEKLKALSQKAILVYASYSDSVSDLEDDAISAIEDHVTAYEIFATQPELLQDIQISTLPEQEAKVSYFTRTEHYDLPSPSNSVLERLHYGIWTFVARKGDLCGAIEFNAWDNKRGEIRIRMEKLSEAKACRPGGN